MQNMLNNIFCRAVINKCLIFIILQVHFIHLIYTKTSCILFRREDTLVTHSTYADNFGRYEERKHEFRNVKCGYNLSNGFSDFLFSRFP